MNRLSAQYKRDATNLDWAIKIQGYRLKSPNRHVLNGIRIQWGGGSCYPQWMEAVNPGIVLKHAQCRGITAFKR